MNQQRKVVITGLGAVSCLGLSADEFWQGLLEGRCGLGTIRAFDASEYPCRLAGEVPEYKINKHVPKSYRKAVKLMSRDIELAILAANEAFAAAGLVTKAAESGEMNYDPTRMAINVGAGLISCDLVEIAPAIHQSLTDGKFDLHEWGRRGMEHLTPIWLLKYLPNMPACHIGIIHDIQGPSNTITTGEVSSLIAVGEAGEVILRGDADLALAGGCEAKVNPIVMLRQCLLERSTFKSNDNPAAACRPFDADAAGSVFAEGAGMLMLEEAEHARARGAEILAEIAGSFSSNCPTNDFVHVEQQAEGIQIAIEEAMRQAGITPGEIDLIIPCGSGIPKDDRAEALAIEKALGDAASAPPVLPVKSMTGHTGASAGSLDLITAVKALHAQTIPAAKNCDRKAQGCGLNISSRTKQKAVRNALVCGYSFGGQAAAIILRKGDLS